MGHRRAASARPLTIVRCTGPVRRVENGGMRCAAFQRGRSGGRGDGRAVRAPRAACRAGLPAAGSHAAEGRARPAGEAWPRPALSHLVSACLGLSRVKKQPPARLTSLRHEPRRAAPNRVEPGWTARDVARSGCPGGGAPPARRRPQTCARHVKLLGGFVDGEEAVHHRISRLGRSGSGSRSSGGLRGA